MYYHIISSKQIHFYFLYEIIEFKFSKIHQKKNVMIVILSVDVWKENVLPPKFQRIIKSPIAFQFETFFTFLAKQLKHLHLNSIKFYNF